MGQLYMKGKKPPSNRGRANESSCRSPNDSPERCCRAQSARSLGKKTKLPSKLAMSLMYNHPHCHVHSPPCVSVKFPQGGTKLSKTKSLAFWQRKAHSNWFLPRRTISSLLGFITVVSHFHPSGSNGKDSGSGPDCRGLRVIAYIGTPVHPATEQRSPLLTHRALFWSIMTLALTN